jgi:uncharacterized protein YkwD
MISHMFRAASTLAATTVLAGSLSAVPAHADHDNNTLGPNNSRLNDSLAQGAYILQHQAGCTNDVNLNPQLNQAAQWHADDLMNNRALDSDIGTDGSTPRTGPMRRGFQAPSLKP